MSGLITIREARRGDAAAISALISSLARYFLADPDRPEAAAAFFETITPDAIARYLDSGRYRYHLAEAEGRLLGVVGVRDGTHLYHLFVAEPFQRRRVASRLWTRARFDARPGGGQGAFTVNSSVHALPLYERFGFRRLGESVEKDGIVFVPMALAASAPRPIPAPDPGEFPAYAGMYIDLIPPDGRLLEHLRRNLEATLDLIAALPEERYLHRYAPGKWTIKEVLVHIVDDERIYAYRALRFARGDATELPGFEQDDFARRSGANEREMEGILREYSAVRHATIELLEGLPDEALTRGGIANGHFATVRALAYHIAGHEQHHLNLLRERYLDPGAAAIAVPVADLPSPPAQ